jgi:basic amino acid/polyamine antiporter, APA family
MPSSPETANSQLVRRLGLFDATMIVMGGIIGSGIFMNPYVVAQRVHTSFLILGVWIFGGVLALIAAFIWAELATRRPDVGGQYAYLREAFHPMVAFLYGWVLLLVIQTGGMAAVSVTFSRYFIEMTHLRISDSILAAIVLAVLTIINCFGVKAGSTVQSILMILKILAIVALVVCGLMLVAPNAVAPSDSASLAQPASFDLLTAIGTAMVPVLFAYGGWQTATFVAAEIREPERNLSRGLIFGVAGVVLLYVAANYVYLRMLGPVGLAEAKAPASEVMRRALGDSGARIMAAGIAISTVGFLSQSMLTAPRVYFAMAKDGLFFNQVAKVHPRTHAPVVAIALQGAFAILIAFWGRYEQILNYVVSMDFIFFGLTACCLFVFRKRETSTQTSLPTPGHPFTTLIFIAACWLVVINTIVNYPNNTLIGMCILIAGVPAYFFWSRRSES